MRVRWVERIFLYDEGAAEALNIDSVARYLRGRVGQVGVEVRGNPLPTDPTGSLDCARALASIKIQDPRRRMTARLRPLHGEIQYERRRILGKTRAFGVLYDGFQLQRTFAKSIAQRERSVGLVHIFFTNRLFATWEEGDKRYHARTSLYGLPSVVSTTGIVEAPARPREYYLLKQQYEALGRDLLELNDRFAGRFIGYDDERLTEVAKGYALQAVFHSLTGNPFCMDRGCRLYNAHWQEELIAAQLGGGYELCEEHARILSSLGAS